MPRRQLIKREDVEVGELPGNEVFVYDRRQKVTHHLPPEVALVWEKCDGSNNRADLERIILSEFNVAEPKLTVREAISRLDVLNLLRR
jgi:hypothetical protein